MQNSSIARAQDKSVDATAAAARMRTEQELDDFTQRELSQFERVKANLQQWAEQELEQTHRENRNRGKDRSRVEDRDRDKERERDREAEENEVSTDSILKQQQKTSNNVDFYEMFQAWSYVHLLLKNIRSQRYLIIDDQLKEI